MVLEHRGRLLKIKESVDTPFAMNLKDIVRMLLWVWFARAGHAVQLPCWNCLLAPHSPCTSLTELSKCEAHIYSLRPMAFDDLKAKTEGDRRLNTEEKIVKQSFTARGIVLLPYLAVAALKAII